MWQRFLAWDQEISQRLSVLERRSTLRRLGMVFAHSGDSWFWFLGLGMVYWLGEGEWKTRALIYIFCILMTAIFVMLIKFTVRRRRPTGEWGAIYRKTDPHSFPSGHAARAALLAVLGFGLGPVWWGVLLALWAPLVILARVAMGVHYLSDVLAGSVLGLIIGAGFLIILPQLSFPF